MTITPLSQESVRTTYLPLASTSTGAVPTPSPIDVPTSEFPGDTAPATPAVPAQNVAAPALAAAALSHEALRITTLPLPRSDHASPTRSPVVLPTNEFAAPTVPDTPLAPAPNVTAPASMAAALSQPGLATK